MKFKKSSPKDDTKSTPKGKKVKSSDQVLVFESKNAFKNFSFKKVFNFHLSLKSFVLIIYSMIVFASAILFLVVGPQMVQLVEDSAPVANNKLLTDLQGSIIPAPKEPEIEVKDNQIPVPTLSSGAVLVKDYETDTILYQKNIDQKMSPASTTKIMTALVGLDYYSIDSILTIPPAAVVDGSTMNLEAGERLSFRSLLYGMMLNSGNDAAFAIAYNYPGGMEGFITAMNEKAQKLGLKNSSFTNPAGFDNPNHYSSARDLSIIAAEAEKNPQFARIVETKNTTVTSVDGTKEHVLKNLNELLGTNGVIGIKTGFTEQSGENLVALSQKDNRKLLTIVLNSQDRFGETKKLIDWSNSNFVWVQN